MVSRNVVVKIPTGLHIKPAGVLSSTAAQFDAKCEIMFKYHIINLASILNIVASGIRCGDEITLKCTGPEEEKALTALINVLEDRN